MTDTSLTRPRAIARAPLAWSDMVSGSAMVLWMLAGAVAAAGTVMALVHAVATDAPFPPSWLRTISLLLWLCLLPLPGLALGTLLAQRAVWAGRVAPRPALQAVGAAWRWTLGLGLALTLLPLWLLAVLVLPPPAAGALALFSSGLMLGTLALGSLACAAWRGLISSAWVLPGLGALVATPWVWATPAEAQAWQAATGWRAAVLLALAASPVVAVRVLREALRSEPGVACRPVSANTPNRSLQARWQRWQHEWGGRLRALDAGSAAGMMGGIWGQLPQQFINRNPEGLMFLPWGSSFTPLGGYRLLLFTMLALVLLRSPSLHWRHLLAPGAGLRPRLGWEVAVNSYGLLVLMLGLVLGLFALLTVWWADDGAQLWQAAPTLVLRYVPLLLLDLALATALATLLRGGSRSLGQAFAALLVLMGAWGLLHVALWLITGHAMPVLLHRDGRYVVLVALLVAALLAVNQRVWQRVDLGALIRASRPKPDSGVD